MRELVTGLRALVASCVVAACVNTDPIHYEAPLVVYRDAGGTIVAEGGEGGLTLVDLCRGCMTEGPCKPVTDICRGSEKCSTFIDCSLDKYCLNFSFTDLANLPPCVDECRVAAGILGQADPDVVTVGPVVLCSHEADPAKGCGEVCNVQ